MEAQLDLYDIESRDMATKMRQLELEVNISSKRYQEAQGQMVRQREEIAILEGELSKRSVSIQKYTAEMQVSNADVDLVAKQLASVQAILRNVEGERDSLVRERETLRRALDESNAIGKLSSSPARKSLDILETKLLKELGQTTRKISDLERQSTLEQSEKDALQMHSRKLGMENQIAIQCLQKISTKLRDELMASDSVYMMSDANADGSLQTGNPMQVDSVPSTLPQVSFCFLMTLLCSPMFTMGVCVCV